MAVREPVMSEHAKRMIQWRESFLFLEESRFFEIMRMYLGEIKTPYNKQKLTASLEGFLRRKENLIAIKSFLTPEEIEIICAVTFIPDATEEKLTSFFENTYTYSFLYETLLNLEERLILFRTRKEVQNLFASEEQLVIQLNPLLENAFYDLIKVERLLPQIDCEVINRSPSESQCITQEFISCFISYVIENPNLAKQDGTLKKHTLETAGDIFGNNVPKIGVLYTAFLNLGLLKESGRGVEIDWNKLSKFVEQDFCQQLVYIIVSSAGHFSRESLRIQAQLFIDTLRNLDGKAFSKDLFLRTGFLAASRPKEEEISRPAGGSRFAKMLEEGRARLAGNDGGEAVVVSQSGGLERMFEASVLLGVFMTLGTREDGELVYSAGNVLRESEHGSPDISMMLNVDAGMDVNLMPGFKVKDVLPLTKFMSVKRFDTVSTFSISRQSVMRGFDAGLTGSKILELLKERMQFDIPETLVVQIDDWNSSYSSASFYKGYILKVDGKAALAAEHNKVLAPHIHSVIAPGIFLLDVNNDAEALTLIKESGLDFIGKIKSAVYENETLDYFKLNLKGRLINERSGFEVPQENYETENPDEIIESLTKELDDMKLENEQRESLELRINRKVILNASQLNPSILRLERVNADAMDFSGKIYVVEQACKAKEKIEVKYGSGDMTVFGVPLGINKRQDDVYMEIQLIPENTVREYSIGKAKSVKRIRDSIYRRHV